MLNVCKKMTDAKNTCDSTAVSNCLLSMPVTGEYLLQK